MTSGSDKTDSLLGRSLRTTRRADSFKIAVTLRLLGRDQLGVLVDTCHDLTQYAAGAITAHPHLEAHTPPTLTTVCFRYRPRSPRLHTPAAVDQVNASLRRRLLHEGHAVVGRTELPGTGPGRIRLKLTLLNPHTRPSDIDALLDTVVQAGQAEERESERPSGRATVKEA